MNHEDEIILETKDNRYAPAAHEVIEAEFDLNQQLEAEIAKIPDKLAFKIGEVAKIAGVKPFVLRYWETEFDALKPKKSRHNQRMYDRKTVATVLMIKKLLYKDRFSIEGARTALRRLKKETKKHTAIRSAAEHIENVREKVDDLVLEIERSRLLFSQ